MNENMQKEIDNVKRVNHILNFEGLCVPYLGARLYIPSGVFRTDTQIKPITNGFSLSWDNDGEKKGRSYVVSRIDVYDVDKANDGNPDDEIFIGRIWIESQAHDVLTIKSNTRVKETPVSHMDRKMRQVYNATLEFNRIAIKWANNVQA
ncbi:hypothetical protein phiOC_p222 [Ochrobactrum phage vB_OspM_OC]|nr:hypothetical protein phiOC_p222 [Ochrobactrum phage vB_OspM_OC]